MSGPPGNRLRRLLRPWLPATVSIDVLDPALADLQFEAERAQTTAQRRRVMLRGYAGIMRALVLSIEPAGVIRAAVALGALGGMGAVLLTTARAARVDGRVLNSAILAPAMVAPVTLRMLGTQSPSYLFVGSVIVAMLTPVLTGGFGLNDDRSLWTLVRDALVALILFAPIAAAAAIVAGPRREVLSKRAVTAVSLGGGIATAVLLLARWPHGEPLSIEVARAPFYVALFGILFTLTLLPSLLIARLFIVRPAALAITGLACSPVTLAAGAYVDHKTLAACLDAMRHTPISFAAWSLPIAVGAMAVGWRLQPRSPAPNPFRGS